MNTFYSISSLIEVIVNDLIDKAIENDNYWVNIQLSKDNYDLHDIA